MSNITCRFRFECPKQWSELDATVSPDVRFCASCESKVYLAATPADFVQLASETKCVALIQDGMLTLGMPEGYVEPYVLVPPQAYSDKQLYLLKRLYPIANSVVQMKEKFHMKEVKMEGFGGHDARSLQACLQAIGIVSTVITG